MASRSRLSNNKRRQIRQLLFQASQCLEQGKLAMCEQLCRHIEAVDPDNPDAANLRGLIASREGQTGQAIGWFRKALERAPRRAEFHANLAGLQMLAGRPEAALEGYQKALDLEPKLFPARLGKATALTQLRRFDEAIALLEALQQRRPKDADLAMRLFRAHYHAGNVRQAEQWLERALSLDGSHADGWYQLGLLRLENGDADAGTQALRKALELDPDHADAALLLAESRRHTAEDDEVRMLEAMYHRAAPDSERRMKLGFAYGKVLDELDRIDEAFACIEEANAIRHRRSSYDADSELAHLEAIMNTYSAQTFQQTSELDDDTPVFIVGMPRCGSTLVEQILAAHPDVEACGETGLLEETFLRLGERAGRPLTLSDMESFSPEQWREVGETYMRALRRNSTARRLTDKTLSNIRLIGAIHCALPGARIIHVRRHPLDTCWSIHRHHLLGPLFDFGSSLGELGYYYRMYLRLMQHWRQMLPAGVMYELDYEKLVADPETEIRQLVAACGLDWDERCLHFHESKAPVRTASFMQVRRPIADDAVGAWQRYARHLQPLLRILGEYAGAD